MSARSELSLETPIKRYMLLARNGLSLACVLALLAPFLLAVGVLRWFSSS